MFYYQMLRSTEQGSASPIRSTAILDNQPVPCNPYSNHTARCDASKKVLPSANQWEHGKHGFYGRTRINSMPHFKGISFQ